MPSTLANMFSAPSRKRKRRNTRSACESQKYQECRKKINPDCEWVYGSKRGVKTGVIKRHCRTRRNRRRNTLV